VSLHIKTPKKESPGSDGYIWAAEQLAELINGGEYWPKAIVLKWSNSI